MAWTLRVTDDDEAANIINTLSHKKVYYFESDELTPDSKDLFDNVFTKIKTKYNFVLHAYGIVASRPLADFLPTLTIAVKNLATEMTNHNVRQDNLRGDPGRDAGA